MKRKAKFRIGQVVSVRSFYGNFERGAVGMRGIQIQGR